MGPEVLVFLIPIVAIIGGCSVAITKMKLNAKTKGLSESQMTKLFDHIHKLEGDNRELKKEVENLRVIATEDFHSLPPATDQLIEKKIEEVIQKKLLKES